MVRIDVTLEIGSSVLAERKGTGQECFTHLASVVGSMKDTKRNETHAAWAK